MFSNGLPAVEAREVLPPRITKPSSQASHPHSKSQSFVPGGHTLEMWLGTAPESSWDWIPAMVDCSFSDFQPLILI